MTMLLQQGVTAQAEARPEATALVFKGARLTYAALEEASNRLARVLKEAGCRRGDRVGLLMPKMPAAIMAMLGHAKSRRDLRADGSRQPCSAAGEGARSQRLPLHSGSRPCWPESARCLGGRDAHATAHDRMAGRRPALRCRSGVQPARSLAYPATPPAYANTDGDVAHILFTSGSTGIPKGVTITHASVAHLIRWARTYFGIVHTDRISQHPPLRFDVSTFDVFGTFWAGAELHLVPPS